jgi:hypothetical protein
VSAGRLCCVSLDFALKKSAKCQRMGRREGTLASDLAPPPPSVVFSSSRNPFTRLSTPVGSLSLRSHLASILGSSPRRFAEASCDIPRVNRFRRLAQRPLLFHERGALPKAGRIASKSRPQVVHELRKPVLAPDHRLDRAEGGNIARRVGVPSGHGHLLLAAFCLHIKRSSTPSRSSTWRLIIWSASASPLLINSNSRWKLFPRGMEPES